MPDRRPLQFAALDDVMPEGDRLLLGHETTGTRSLAPICHPLAISMRLAVERPAGSSWRNRLVRYTIGPMAARYVLRRGGMPAGLRMPSAALAPKPGLDARAEAE